MSGAIGTAARLREVLLVIIFRVIEFNIRFDLCCYRFFQGGLITVFACFGQTLLFRRLRVDPAPILQKKSQKRKVRGEKGRPSTEVVRDVTK